MNVEQQNRAFFASHDPEFLKELEGVSQEANPEPAKKGGFTICHEGKYVHSKYDPVKEAARAVAGEPCLCHLHFGLGLGYFLAADQPLKTGTIVVFEPNPALALAALKTQPLAAAAAEKNAFICCSLWRLKFLLKQHYRGGALSKKVLSPFHGREYGPLKAQWEQAIEQARFSHDLALKTLAHSMPLFTESALKCLKYTTRLPGIQRLKDLFKDMPAVLVSPGPSLEKNLAQLKACRSRCLVIAVARSAASLERFHIEPDILVHNEPQPFLHLIANRTNLSNTTFALAEQAEPAYFEFPHGPTFVYGNASNLAGRWISHHHPKLEKAAIPTGGSVANDAYAIAHLAGCNPIVLIGQDLSLREDRYYARADINVQYDHKNNLCQVPGYFGGAVTTIKNYLAFLLWFQDYAKKCRVESPHLRLINATEGGAAVDGMEHLKFSEVAWRLFDGDIKAKPLLDHAALIDDNYCLSPTQLNKLLGEGLRRLRSLQDFCGKFRAFEPKLRRKLKLAGPSNLEPAARSLHVFEDFKETYVKLQQDFIVLSGFLQADLQRVNQEKLARGEAPDLKTEMIHDLDHCSATFEATGRAVEKVLPLFSQLMSPSLGPGA